MTNNIILLLFSLIILTSCETWRSECVGEIIVENPIQDTTLYVSGEPFFRDLFAEPVVLRQTEGQEIEILVLEGNSLIADANRVNSPTTGNLNAVKVVPQRAGSTEIQILAEDQCLQIETTFNVTVVDTTQ